MKRIINAQTSFKNWNSYRQGNILIVLTINKKKKNKEKKKADYELFCINDPLSEEKSNLKISYVNKTFQKKPEHFYSLYFYLTNETLFLPTTCSTYI